MMNTFAGGTVPAEVIIIGMALPNSAAPSITALYPARLFCDDRMSIDWAREMRGISSRANAVSPASA
jgi:hypothetical protein